MTSILILIETIERNQFRYYYLKNKRKTFSELFSAFLKCTLNFAHFQKNDDPDSRGISEITVSEKGD